MSKEYFMNEAIKEAKLGLSEGGIPIGSVIVHKGVIIGRGRNRRVQESSAIRHAEMDAIENAGRRSAKVYRECEIYTTLSPCSMCSGAIMLYGFNTVIIGENKTFLGEERMIKSARISVKVLNNKECIQMMSDFIENKPSLWKEDIGEKNN